MDVSNRDIVLTRVSKAYDGQTVLQDLELRIPDGTITAVMGMVGLRPTLAAIEAKKRIGLANKETLVCAGELVMANAARRGAEIIPVDSEHSAIFQCLQGAAGNTPVKLLLTASGGPFRTWEKDRIAEADKTLALKHPNWSMGAKITIDSATMMNKGFEVIEACWLFDMAPEDVHVVVHPESVIHSMIEFEDGAVLAQLGCPDMRVPIQFALAFPERLPLKGERLDFASLGSLTFQEPDREKFPCLGLAFEAVRRGGNIPCAMNAANEAAVKAFLEDRIRFYDIPEVIAGTMAETPYITKPSLEDIFATNDAALAAAEKRIARK